MRRLGMLILIVALVSCKESKPQFDLNKICGDWAIEGGYAKIASIDKGQILTLKKFKEGKGITLTCSGDCVFFTVVDGKKIPMKFHQSKWGVNENGLFVWHHQQSKVSYQVQEVNDSVLKLKFNEILAD